MFFQDGAAGHAAPPQVSDDHYVIQARRGGERLNEHSVAQSAEFHLRPVPTHSERPSETASTKEPRRADGPAEGTVVVPKRLVVELNKRSSADLAWLVETEELNKTTIVNRAIQVYATVIEAQLKGRSIAIVDTETGEGETIRIF